MQHYLCHFKSFMLVFYFVLCHIVSIFIIKSASEVSLNLNLFLTRCHLLEAADLTCTLPLLPMSACVSCNNTCVGKATSVSWAYTRGGRPARDQRESGNIFPTSYQQVSKLSPVSRGIDLRSEGFPLVSPGPWKKSCSF